MTYELAKKLKDAGYPQKNKYFCDGCANPKCAINEYENAKPDYQPSFSELIEACGYVSLEGEGDDWTASDMIMSIQKGSTPEEAVANLWLELNKKI